MDSQYQKDQLRHADQFESYAHEMQQVLDEHNGETNAYTDSIARRRDWNEQLAQNARDRANS